MAEIKYEIVERIAVLGERPRGWERQLNLISWNDGDPKYDIRDWSPDGTRMGKGDATSASIGAATVLTKVSRDRYMLELDKQYPQYQLAKHKGYPTKLHYELIEQYGIQPFYRRSFLKKQGYWPEGK